MPDILVLTHMENGAPDDSSRQCLAAAGELADGGTVTALVVGSGVTGAAASCFASGADKVLVADAPELETYLTGPYKKVLKEALARKAYPVVLLPGNTSGNDLAPVVAAEIKAACVVDCDEVYLSNGHAVAKRLEYDRKVFTHYRPEAATVIVTLKDGAAEAGSPDPARTGDVESFAVSFDDADKKTRVVRRDVTEKSANLKEARIIVGAGAGIGTKEKFGLIRQLAEALGAEIGATRAVVDAGWLPADHQIGQTGAVVHPEVYIACGISGAVQHWVGMSESRTIVSINTDKNAPLMRKAHYRIEGDLNTVVPKLIKLLQ